ncbi:MAG: heat-inducible transcriptional repressor HrcA [Alphaproteobacteria bacterium]|nr:heat-inducible transcriptional repressor HrcA [Alphaproteobacteria bacterium]
MIAELNERSREILRHVVEAYVETGEPVGSRTLSRRLGLALSPATIRNVMADLEEFGLLFAPHTSAGRLPTEQGLRLFVDGILQVGALTKDERSNIDSQCKVSGRSVPQVLEEATALLSGLSHCAGLVMAPKRDLRLKHIEFVNLGPGRALVVMVDENGGVENRVIDLPLGMPASSLVEASNFMAAKLVGRTLQEARAEILAEVKSQRGQIDELTGKVVEAGLATRSEDSGSGVLIVRGQANLLDDIGALADLEQIRALFEALETKEALIRLLEAADVAEGVQIFIGAENELFTLAGASMIIAPYTNREEKLVGAIGVIGPTRMNYGRIIPMVDYTAKLISRVIG